MEGNQTADYYFKEAISKYIQRDAKGWLESINKALYIEPNNIKYILFRAYHSYLDGKYEQAITDFTTYIDMTLAGLRDAYMKRHLSYSELGLEEEALANINKLIEHGLEANFDNYRLRAFHMYKKGNYDRAIADFTSAYYLDPKHSINLLNRAHAYYGAKLYRNALHDLELALEFSDDEHTKNAIYFWFGKVYYQIDDHPKSLVNFNRYAEFEGREILNTAQEYMELLAPDEVKSI